jgi:hypothetical protein
MFALACLLMVRRVWMQSWLPQSFAGTIHEMRQKLPVRRGGRS